MEGETVGPLELPGGFKLPARINRKLYWYQRTGVRWLWELYRQGAGGILGDEMGLGKTVQVSAFLGGLQRSGRLRGGGLIVAPATLMSQWASELYAWAPWLRVVLLHRSAAAFAAQPAHKVGRFVRKVLEMADGGGRGRRGGGGMVCLTTYESLKLLRKELLGHAWAYVALDEGQKIRNPDAEVGRGEREGRQKGGWVGLCLWLGYILQLCPLPYLPSLPPSLSPSLLPSLRPDHSLCQAASNRPPAYSLRHSHSE